MSLPGYGSLEVSCKVGKPFVEVHIHELIGFISCLLQLMYQVTKLHKGLAEKVLFCTVPYCTLLVYFVSAMLLLSALLLLWLLYMYVWKAVNVLLVYTISQQGKYSNTKTKFIHLFVKKNLVLCFWMRNILIFLFLLLLLVCCCFAQGSHPQVFNACCRLKGLYINHEGSVFVLLLSEMSLFSFSFPSLLTLMCFDFRMKLYVSFLAKSIICTISCLN